MFKADNDGQQAPSSSKLMPRKFSAKRKQTSLLSDLTHFKRRATLAAQICAERLRLMTVFNDHVEKYAGLVNRSRELLAEGRTWELADLRRACRLEWGNAEEARLALYRHESAHGCEAGRSAEQMRREG